MKCNWVLLCYKDVENDEMEILHKCVYEVEPKSSDITSLVFELESDEDFDMTDLVYSKDYEILKIDLIESPQFREILDIPEELN